MGSLDALRRLLAWIDPADAEEYGVTLHGLVTASLMTKNRVLARHFLKMQQTVPEDDWPEKPIFVILSQAEMAKTAKRYGQAELLLDEVEALVPVLAPQDSWGHLPTIAQLRAAIANIRRNR
ncbi:MAG: hypothetical protein H7833_13380 [Magnetococcus sp. DMHC-1]